MKNQYFKLEIAQKDNGTQVTGEFKASPKFLTHFFGQILKEQPFLITVFLDAAGEALISSGNPQPSDEPKELEYFVPTPEDLRFYDELFG